MSKPAFLPGGFCALDNPGADPLHKQWFVLFPPFQLRHQAKLRVGTFSSAVAVPMGLSNGRMSCGNPIASCADFDVDSTEIQSCNTAVGPGDVGHTQHRSAGVVAVAIQYGV